MLTALILHIHRTFTTRRVHLASVQSRILFTRRYATRNTGNRISPPQPTMSPSQVFSTTAKPFNSRKQSLCALTLYLIIVLIEYKRSFTRFSFAFISVSISAVISVSQARNMTPSTRIPISHPSNVFCLCICLCRR